MHDNQHSELIENLLIERGITEETRDAFLQPSYEHLHDPFLLSDCEKAVRRIYKSMATLERIAVYADFDCDGIPGAVVLHDFFKKIGYRPSVEIYIPHRDAEGYGFHKEAVDALKKSDVKLIITVDVGCTSHETIAYAQGLGIDVIVTDHHECTEILPPAYAIVNPKLSGYPFPHLCGAAVAYKLVQALIRHGQYTNHAQCNLIPVGWEKWLLDMVGIATVADVVPLIGENRIFARFGLTVLKKSRRPGILALLKKARVTQSKISEDDIAFSIAPRINSASRVGDPRVAFDLFSTEDVLVAEESAKKIERWNTQRKAATGVITKAAKERIALLEVVPNIIVLGSHEWKTSLLGSVASALVGTYGRPVCLWGREATGNIKGSARSDGSVSIITLLQRAAPAITQSGGHVAAGGYVVNPEMVHLLGELLERAYAEECTKNVGACAAKGIETSLAQVTPQLLRSLDVLRPFGEGNRNPLFIFSSVSVVDVKNFGKHGEHLEMYLKAEHGIYIRGFCFFTTQEQLFKDSKQGSPVSVLGTIERDSFRGGVPSIRIVSVN